MHFTLCDVDCLPKFNASPSTFFPLYDMTCYKLYTQTLTQIIRKNILKSYIVTTVKKLQQSDTKINNVIES